MTRERRANLLFLAIFLVVSLPGLFLLLRKKTDATIRPMGSPENVRPHLVFIDPVDAPADIPRMAPSLTMAWVGDLARARFGSNRVLMRADAMGTERPLMSERRLAQIVDARREGEAMRYAFIVWNLPRGTSEARISSPAHVAATALIEVPASVKQDLQMSGLPAPPQKVLWAEIVVDIAPHDGGLGINVVADGQTLSDRFSGLTARVE